MFQSAPPKDAVSVIDQEFLVDDPCSVSVNVPGSLTHLQPTSQSERVTVAVSVADCSSSEADAVHSRLQIGAHQVQDEVIVASDADRLDAEWWRWVRTRDVTLHIALGIPTRVKANLVAAAGTVEISNLEGRFDLDVMSGACHTHNLNGSLNIRAESSTISVEDFSGDDLFARVSVGDVSLSNVNADSVTLRSVGAPVSLTNLQAPTTVTANSTSVTVRDQEGPCTVRSQGGPLHYHGRPTEETNLTVVGSTLDAHFPSSHGVDLQMSGPQFALDDRFSFSGERTEHQIEGPLNGGGPSVTLESIGGSAKCHVA